MISLFAPIAYLVLLIGSLGAFSHYYRRRKSRQQAAIAQDPWFPNNTPRDLYLTLLHKYDDVPKKLLVAALLLRAQEDVSRIWRLREQKQSMQSLIANGSVGDDLVLRFAAAERELEAELTDLVAEADALHPGWSSTIFATATEMVHHANIKKCLGGSAL